MSLGNKRGGTNEAEVRQIAREEDARQVVDNGTYTPFSRYTILDEDNKLKIWRAKDVNGDGSDFTVTSVTDFTEIRNKFENLTDPTGEDDYRGTFGIEKIDINLIKPANLNIELTDGFITYYNETLRGRQTVPFTSTGAITAKKRAWDGTDLGDSSEWDFTSLDNGTDTPTLVTDGNTYLQPILFMDQNFDFIQLISNISYSSQNDAGRQQISIPNPLPTFLNGYRIVGKMMARQSENRLNRTRVFALDGLRNENKVGAVGTTSETVKSGFIPVNVANYNSVIGEKYLGSAGASFNLPTTRGDGSPLEVGDSFTIRNSTPIIGGVNIPINGDVLLPVSLLGITTNIFGVQPSLTRELVWNGTNFEIEAERPLHLSVSAGSVNGLEIFDGHFWTITNSTVGAKVRLEERAGGITNIKLSSTSTRDFTVEQFDTASANSDFILEDGSTAKSFEIPVKYRNQEVRIEGDTENNKWRIYRPWELDIIAPSKTYTNGEVVNENNTTANDGNVRVLQIPNDYASSDVTAGESWQFEPGENATFPFTFPDITNGATLFIAIDQGLIKPLAPENVSLDKKYVYKAGNKYRLASLDLNYNQGAWFVSETNANANFELEASTSFGKKVFVNGTEFTATGAFTNVSILGARRAIVWQTFTDQNATVGNTYIETFSEDSNALSILEKIIVDVSSAGTDAGSSLSFTITDEDGNVYPLSDFRVTSAWTQTSGTADNINYSDAVLTSPITVGRNKSGFLELEYVGTSPNGTLSIDIAANSGATSGEVKFKFVGNNDTIDFTNAAAVTLTQWTTNVNEAPQQVLPDWEAAQDYTYEETKVVGIAPANVDPQVEGRPYILRPKQANSPLTSDANLDITEWNLYDVLGEYQVKGGTVRTIDNNGTYSVTQFTLENGSEGNIWIVPEGFNPTFRWVGVVDVAFLLSDYSNGLVSNRVTGANQEFTLTGAAKFTHTKDGNFHKVTVEALEGGASPVQRKEQTYFAHTIPNNAEGIYEVNGQTVTDADLADFITNNPITGWSVSGSDVVMPDWRGRYLGASGGLGINTTAGQTLASVNKAHSHTVLPQNDQLLSFAPGGFGIRTTFSPSSEQTGSSGSTYARPETVGLPLCIIVGTAQEYVKASDVVDVSVVTANATQAVNDAGDAKIAEINALGSPVEIVHLIDSANNSLTGTNAVVNYETEAFVKGTGAERESGGGILIKANSGVWALEATVATSGDVRGSFRIWNYTTNAFEVTSNAATLTNEESLARAMSAPTIATVEPTVDTIYRVRVQLTSNLSTTSVDTWGVGYFKATKL